MGFIAFPYVGIRQVKRLESANQSRVFALFSSSIDGFVRFMLKMSLCICLWREGMLIDEPYFIFNGAARWFGIPVDLLVSILSLLTGILSVGLHDRRDAAAVALIQTYCINLMALFYWCVRQSTEAENFITRAETIYE